MNSLWEKTVELPKFGRPENDIKTDVLIIGGGITGILCAHMLHEANINYVLAEAKTICSGVTGNTTAKITSQHGLIYDKLIRRFGTEKASLYLQANEEALRKYRNICRNTDCDFEDTDTYVYSLNNRKKIEDELTALDRIGFKAEFAEKIPLPFEIAGAVKFKNQAQFNPLKFLSSIAKGLNIYEHTKITELEGTEADTGHGKISAKKIIVATHFPFINKHGAYFIKMYQHRSYVIALENAPEINGAYVDEQEKGMSFRRYQNLLLIGGGDHRTGRKGGAWQELRDFAKKHYPNANEKYCFATQDCITLDDVPYIGEYSSGTQNLYTATGFNKWGMTSSMAAAAVLTDMIQGKTNPYAEVFSPSRSILHPRLAMNVIEAAAGLLTPSQKRCPHMGCALKWNCTEHTWDCTCHGSRFSKTGELIDNPATDDIRIK